MNTDRSHVMSVQQILNKKGNAVWSIGPRELTLRALELMAEKDVGALLVINEGQLVGVFSERDYARKVVLQGKASDEISVSEFMTTDLIEATPHTSVDECMAMMTHHRVRHLPVRRNGEIVGVLSIGDVVNAKINDQEFEIEQMKGYIAAS